MVKCLNDFTERRGLSACCCFFFSKRKKSCNLPNSSKIEISSLGDHLFVLIEAKFGLLKCQIGLDRIARKQNVSTPRILQYSFCEKRNLLSRSMKFIRSTFSLITIAITRSPFLCSDRAQNFSRSQEHFWNLEVRCDWSKYSADAHVGGTRGEYR